MVLPCSLHLLPPFWKQQPASCFLVDASQHIGAKDLASTDRRFVWARIWSFSGLGRRKGAGEQGNRGAGKRTHCGRRIVRRFGIASCVAASAPCVGASDGFFPGRGRGGKGAGEQGSRGAGIRTHCRLPTARWVPLSAFRFCMLCASVPLSLCPFNLRDTTLSTSAPTTSWPPHERRCVWHGMCMRLVARKRDGREPRMVADKRGWIGDRLEARCSRPLTIRYSGPVIRCGD